MMQVDIFEHRIRPTVVSVVKSPQVLGQASSLFVPSKAEQPYYRVR